MFSVGLGGANKATATRGQVSELMSNQNMNSNRLPVGLDFNGKYNRLLELSFIVITERCGPIALV